MNTEKDFGAIKKKPLSYGFINKGDIWFALKYNFTDELTMRNRIGQNLVDFAWIDNKIVITSLQMLWDTYAQARNKKDEYSFITVAILERAKRFLSANVYLSVYLFAFIDFLLEDTIDERVVSKDFIFDSDWLDIPNNSNIHANEKFSFIDHFADRSFAIQKSVQKSLDTILVNRTDNSDLTPATRLSLLENTDEFYKNNWGTRFTSFIGKPYEGAKSYVQLTELDTITDMLRYELTQLVLKDVPYKICKCCNELFIPKGRSDSLYCLRIMPGRTKPCSVIGANLVAVEKRNTDPVLKTYRKAYERLKKRVELGYMTDEDFFKWDDKAKEMRGKCKNNKISFVKFEKWIDDTSRKRKTKDIKSDF